MKKYVIKISLAFVVIAALVLILVGLRSIDGGGTAPSYRFLAGRNPIACKDLRTKDVDKMYAYSFEADFNDLCLKADAELIPAGFIDNTQPLNKSIYHDYWLRPKFPRGGIHIGIVNNHQCIEIPNSNDYSIWEREGWIAVQIFYYRGWRWPF